jgi:hypothetical protein
MTEPPGVPPSGGQPPRYPAPNFPAPAPQSPTYPATSAPGPDAAPPEYAGDDLFSPPPAPPPGYGADPGADEPSGAQFGDEYAMDPEAAGRRRAAHGADRSRGSGLLPLLLILLAVAAVAVAVVVVTRAINHGSTPAATSPTPIASDTGGPSTSPSATPSDSGSPSESPSPSPSKSHHSPSPSPTRTSNPVATAPKIPVTVFNQTTVPGAAAALAAQLSADGWPIAGVDNWRGFVPSTTVYYWPGDQNSALRLARESDAINRVRPALAPMPTGSLVVIIAN